MEHWGGDAVLTLEEVAAFLKISETTTYQLVRVGELRGRKVGREWRILKSEVVAWLQKGSEVADSAVMQDETNGGEYRVNEDGQEEVALWLPMSREQKTKMIAKATKRKTSVGELFMHAFKDFF